MKIIFLNLSFFILTSAFLTTNIDAQQAVFNVPSADILDKGQLYIELDAAFKPNNQEALRRFSSFVPRAVVGTGGNVEIGLNVTGNVTPGADSTTLVPIVKYRFYQSEKKDLSLFAGQHFYFPVRNKSYNFGSYSYAAAAKTINKTRLTAGAFVFSRSVVAPDAVRAGGQFAVEQTISDKLTIAADYYTGRHANGYLTPGVIYKPHPQVTTYWSYSIGNAQAKKGNHFFLFELGYSF